MIGFLQEPFFEKRFDLGKIFGVAQIDDEMALGGSGLSEVFVEAGDFTDQSEVVESGGQLILQVVRVQALAPFDTGGS